MAAHDIIQIVKIEKIMDVFALVIIIIDGGPNRLRRVIITIVVVGVFEEIQAIFVAWSSSSSSGTVKEKSWAIFGGWTLILGFFENWGLGDVAKSS